MNPNFFNSMTGRALPTPSNVGGTAQMEPTINPQNLGHAVMAMLRQAQEQGRRTMYGAQHEQTQRSTAELPPDLANMQLSPSDQLRFRRGEVGAIEPTVGGARSLVQEASSGINEVKDYLEELRKIDETKQRTAQEAVQAAIQSGYTGLQDLINSAPEVVKAAGYDSKTLLAIGKGLKSKEDRDAYEFSVLHGGGSPSSGVVPGVNPKTGSKYKFDTPEDIAKLPISDITKSIIAGYGSAKDLTPTMRETVVKELYQVGFNPYQVINRKLDALLQTYAQVTEEAKGLVGGYTPTRFSATAARFESEKQLLTREVARLRDVGVLSDQDVASYNSALPSRTDRNYDVAAAKVEGVKASLGSGVAGSGNNTPGTVRMSGPKGTFDVPANQVENFRANGYTEI